MWNNAFYESQTLAILTSTGQDKIISNNIQKYASHALCEGKVTSAENSLMKWDLFELRKSFIQTFLSVIMLLVWTQMLDSNWPKSFVSNKL